MKHEKKQKLKVIALKKEGDSIRPMAYNRRIHTLKFYQARGTATRKQGSAQSSDVMYKIGQ